MSIKATQNLFYQCIFESIADAVFIYPLHGETAGAFIAVNPEACSLLGYSQDELLAMTPYDLMNLWERQHASEYANRLLQDGARLFSRHNESRVT